MTISTIKSHNKNMIPFMKNAKQLMKHKQRMKNDHHTYSNRQYVNKAIIGYVVLFSFSQIANAQVSISSLSQTDTQKFPVVAVAKQPEVSAKINTLLQLKYLERLPDDKKAVSKAVTAAKTVKTLQLDEDDGCCQNTFTEWHQYKTPKNILSLSFSGEFTGAYTATHTNYTNFDTRSGNPVLLDNIIKPSRQQALNDVLVAMIKKQITEFIDTVKADDSQDNNQNDSQDDNEDNNHLDAQIHLYETCIAELDDMSLDWFSFYVKAHSVVFIRERCSNHAMRALDDIGEIRIELPISTLQPYLLKYGKNVLSDSSKQLTSSRLTNKLLTGKLGKASVQFVLTEVRDDDTINATYWYSKYKQPIELTGTFKNNQFTANEHSYDEKKGKWTDKGSIKATWKHGELTGTWRNVKTGKKYQLTLEE